MSRNPASAAVAGVGPATAIGVAAARVTRTAQQTQKTPDYTAFGSSRGRIRQASVKLRVTAGSTGMPGPRHDTGCTWRFRRCERYPLA